jgi:hypothetical protein
MKNLKTIAFIIAALALGCKLPETLKSLSPGSSPSSNSPGSSNGGPKTAGPEPVKASSEPKEDIIRASARFMELSSFTAQIDGTGTNELHMKMEYVAPDRYHITHTSGPAVGMDTIIVGSDSYVKTGGKWRKLGVDIGSSIPSLRDTFNEQGLRLLTDVKFEGEDAVNGKPSLLYSYSNTTPKDNIAYKSKIWIGKDSGLPQKILVDYAGGSLRQMTVAYDTDATVTIEPPIK